jgi:hypothetical protein
VAAGHLVLAVAVLFGVVRSGGRYFYCEALGLLPSDPCVEASAHGRRDGAPEPLGAGTLGARRVDCCEIVTLGAMPRAAQAAGSGVAPAPLVAVLPAPGAEGAVDLAPSSRLERAFERWRPPPRAASDARAQLMVFLI